MILDVPTAAVALGVSVRTLRRWVAEGAPCCRVGGRVLMDPDEVDSWRRRRALAQRLDGMSS